MALHDQNPDTQNPNTVRASGADTSRFPGFRGLGDVQGPPPGAAIPGAAATPAAAGPTPGVLAAQGTQPHHTSGISKALGFGLAGPLGLGGGLEHGAGSFLTGGLFRHNNSPLQDIQQALAAGNPVSDQSWAMAGYGPGGSYAPAGTQPTGLASSGIGRLAGLSGVTNVPGSPQFAPQAPATAPLAAPQPQVMPTPTPLSAPAPLRAGFASRYANPAVFAALQ